MKAKRSGANPAALRAAVQDLDTVRVAAGWFPSARYKDGTPVAGTMATQEFGSTKMGIPPRPIMRTTQEAHEAEWSALVEKLGDRVIAGKMTADQLENFLGATIVGDIQKTISAMTTPELAESTKYARKHRSDSPNTSEKVLVDRRIAFNTLTYSKD